ncbi:MAG: hypothetical protein GAK41_00483 [Burkholderia gladioli]|nr:MAG: hypothetical protein GAK41_00483 [Burkholderia gladioli]
MLEEHRWASTPADEIRRALSGALTRRLDTIDVADSAVPPSVPVYRVSVDVQRFESWPGSKVAIDAVWSVRALSTQSVMTCRTALAEPVGAGYDALVAGHRKAIGEAGRAHRRGRARDGGRAGAGGAGGAEERRGEPGGGAVSGGSGRLSAGCRTIAGRFTADSEHGAAGPVHRFPPAAPRAAVRI